MTKKSVMMDKEKCNDRRSQLTKIQQIEPNQKIWIESNAPNWTVLYQ